MNETAYESDESAQRMKKDSIAQLKVGLNSRTAFKEGFESVPVDDEEWLASERSQHESFRSSNSEKQNVKQKQSLLDRRATAFY